MTTDWYGLCEAGEKELLQSLTTLFPNPEQVTDDDRILNAGKGEYYAVVRPSTFPTSRVSGTQTDVNWNMLVDFYVRYGNYHEFLPKFKAARALIFEAHPPFCLNSVKGVSRTLLTGGEFIQDMQGDSPNFVGQTFIVTVTQRVTFEIR